MRNAFIDQLTIEAEKNKKIILLAADIGAIVFDNFRKKFPDQFINTGIAESNMIGVAAGLALNGFIPVCYTIVPFATMRCYEQIRTDVCIQNLNVKIAGVGSGISYSSLGPTHHSIEDIGITRVLPNLTVISPSDPVETQLAIAESIKFHGPVYLRLGLAGEPVINIKDNHIFKIGKGKILRKGRNLTIIATGFLLNYAIEATNRLDNIDIEIINISTIKPIDKKIILNSAMKTKKVITLEEHNIIGGLGSAVSEIISENFKIQPVKFIRMGIKDKYDFKYGKREYLYKINKLTTLDIIKTVKKMVTGR